MSWRLLDDRPADGAWNMALDEALLDAWCSGGSALPPLLRLYGWRPAAVSLGKAQALGAIDRRHLASRGVDLVRRPTGGLAVLHDDELTYAVVARADAGPLGGGDVLAAYRRVAAALERGLRSLGVDAQAVGPRPGQRNDGASCFALTSSHEIAVGDRKLVGSAQFRRREAMLQHGSIPLRMDEARVGAALGGAPPGRFTDLARELGGRPDDAALRRAIVAGFELEFGEPLSAWRPGPDLLERAHRLRARKYLSAGWTLDGEAAGISASR